MSEPFRPDISTRRPVMLATLAFFLLMTAYYIIRPVRDQFSGAAGSAALPRYFAYSLAVMVLLTPIFGSLVTRYSRRHLITLSYGFFGLCLLGFMVSFQYPEHAGASWLGLIFFVWTNVFSLFVVALFWSFMADVFSAAAARHNFPLIAFGGMGGALLGPWLAGHMVYWLGVRALLAVSALALLAALLLLRRLDAVNRSQPSASPATARIGGSVWSGVTRTFSRPFLRNITLLMLCGDAVGTLSYVMVADYAKSHLLQLNDRLAFYSHLDLAINLAGAIMQLTVSRALLRRYGSTWGLVVPALVNVGLLAAVGIIGVAPLQVLGWQLVPPVMVLWATRSLMYGMTKPASDALYTRTTREDRYKSKNFIETTMWRVGDVCISSSIKGLLHAGLGMAGIALLATGVAGVGAWAAWRAGRADDLLPQEAAPDD